MLANVSWVRRRLDRVDMNKQQLIFWKSEREMMDCLYRDRLRDWQRRRIRGRAKLSEDFIDMPPSLSISRKVRC